MQMTQLVQKIARNDVKVIGRDSFMVMMFAYIMIMAVILRFALPWLDTYLAENEILPLEFQGVTLSAMPDLYPMLVAYMTIYLGAVLIGVIFGFMLLDEKDDNTLKAMLVTPVSINQYIMYRVGVPVVIGFFGVIAAMLIINQALVPLWQLIPIAAAAALTAPIATLFFAVTAENKVQGFAMSKFIGVSGMGIFVGWFIPEPWQWLLGLFPPFWTVKAYWMALDGNNFWWIVLIGGIVLQLGMIYGLAKRFNTVAYR